MADIYVLLTSILV